MAATVSLREVRLALIEDHWPGIVSYCHADNKVSLGFVEGLNNKIRTLQKRAYGLLRTRTTSSSKSSPACCRRSDRAAIPKVP